MTYVDRPAAAARNLADRIQHLLLKLGRDGPTAYEGDRLALAIDMLSAGDYPAGEDAVRQAETATSATSLQVASMRARKEALTREALGMRLSAVRALAGL